MRWVAEPPGHGCALVVGSSSQPHPSGVTPPPPPFRPTTHFIVSLTPCARSVLLPSWPAITLILNPCLTMHLSPHTVHYAPPPPSIFQIPGSVGQLCPWSLLQAQGPPRPRICPLPSPPLSPQTQGPSLVKDLPFSRTYTLGCYRLAGLASSHTRDLLNRLPVNKR